MSDLFFLKGEVIHYKANAKACHLRLVFFVSHWSNIQEHGRSNLSTPVSVCQHVLELEFFERVCLDCLMEEKHDKQRCVEHTRFKCAIMYLEQVDTLGNFDTVQHNSSNVKRTLKLEL